MHASFAIKQFRHDAHRVDLAGGCPAGGSAQHIVLHKGEGLRSGSVEKGTGLQPVYTFMQPGQEELPGVGSPGRAHPGQTREGAVGHRTYRQGDRPTTHRTVAGPGFRQGNPSPSGSLFPSESARSRQRSLQGRGVGDRIGRLGAVYGGPGVRREFIPAIGRRHQGNIRPGGHGFCGAPVAGQTDFRKPVRVGTGALGCVMIVEPESQPPNMLELKRSRRLGILGGPVGVLEPALLHHAQRPILLKGLFKYPARAFAIDGLDHHNARARVAASVKNQCVFAAGKRTLGHRIEDHGVPPGKLPGVHQHPRPR